MPADRPEVPELRQRHRLRIRGLVQGVGFRPFVYALATRLHLSGWVYNDGAGVLLEVEGPPARLEVFTRALTAEAPPLARIDALESQSRAPAPAESAGFIIRASDSSLAVCTGIGPDAAVCPACLAELFNPDDRRYRYPFLNCTHCGPRYTIARKLPYDRPNTALAGFPLCPDCAREYHTPDDRRFHAQPIACPACGPRLSHSIADILAHIRAGAIVGLKGLGGFHLVCDAHNPEAVIRLRQRKQRDGKPFALMLANSASAHSIVDLSPAEARMLERVERPIVLVRGLTPALAPAIAPDLAWLGIMLPYTPVHYLLFHEAAGRPEGMAWLEDVQPLALVMTSANPGGEPLAIGNDEARQRLAGIADVVVDHDRPILVRADDSLLRWVAGAPMILRRARGWVPVPVRLPRAVPPVLAVGGYLKTTICLARDREAWLSPHLGDLDNAATIGFFEESIAHLSAILQIRPERVAHDRHPEFYSSHYAAGLGLPCVSVQHHHAHLAAVAAEHGLATQNNPEQPMLGLALDGFGLGADGGAWGGEMLLLEDGGARFRRLGHLGLLPQPGGDRAARQPWRMAAAALFQLGQTSTEIAERFAACGPAEGVAQMLEQDVNCPRTSSCGRWFDAACGLLGVRLNAGFEGEAPMVLESLVTTSEVLAEGWTIRDQDGHTVLDLLPLLDALRDLSPHAGANRFHGTLIAALIAWTVPALRAHGLRQVLLSGGCLMNGVLAGGLVAGFAAHGITALVPRQVPANDGGLSLGQAWVAALADG